MGAAIAVTPQWVDCHTAASTPSLEHPSAIGYGRSKWLCTGRKGQGFDSGTKRLAMTLSKKKWIFWDNDGVLVDTESLYFQASRETLASIGIDLTRDLFELISIRQGRSTFSLAENKGIDPDTLHKLHEDRNRRYSELLGNGIRVMEGVYETLDRLSGTCSMGVVTSCRKMHFDLIHTDLKLLEYFEFVITSEDVNHTKPDPEPYLMALEKSGCTPADCLVVEDAERGLHSATAAGIDCIVIPNGFTMQGDFSSAYRILDNISGVIDELPYSGEH
jgi:HAD superfamily hydrolase (TIGR01509 family)